MDSEVVHQSQKRQTDSEVLGLGFRVFVRLQWIQEMLAHLKITQKFTLASVPNIRYAA